MSTGSIENRLPEILRNHRQQGTKENLQKDSMPKRGGKADTKPGHGGSEGGPGPEYVACVFVFHCSINGIGH
jgi:hypothetical protein